MALQDLLHTWSLLGVIVIVPLLAVLVHDYRQWKSLPPGPRPLPFIGNKRDVPAKYPWIKFQEWSRIYGPIYTIWLGRRPTIIISDPIVAVELLEKRSNKYSSRPRFVVMGEIYWENASILVQQYGKEWSTRRKLLHSALTPRALEDYQEIQQAEACRLCYQLLSRPKDWESLLDWMTASIVFAIAYGHRIDSLDSPVIRERMAIMHYASSLNIPGKYFAESFPIFKHVPLWLAPWKRDIKKHGKVESSANMRLMNYISHAIEQNPKKAETALPPSLCKSLLLRRTARPQDFALLSERDLSFIPASLFGAGADTTASTLCSAFLALITHPETLVAAHAELDAVIGLDCLPTFADEAQLPYIRALCKEVLRWRPVAVLGGTPHATSEDDVYQGWKVPKGTNVLGNSWAINHNEEYYPNSQRFEPLRFLDEEDVQAVQEKLPYLDTKYVSSGLEAVGIPQKRHPGKWGHSSFGWGRRICPGAELAVSASSL